MPKGLALPLGVGPGGGMRIAKGAENDNKIVTLALGDCSNGNAFQQDMGLGVQGLFEVNDENSAKSSVMVRLRQIFDKFKRERRYELIENTIQISQENDRDREGSVVLNFKYLSLEANEVRSFSRSLLPSSAGFGDR